MRPSPRTIKLLAAVLTIMAYQEGKALPIANLAQSSDSAVEASADQSENLQDLKIDVGYKGGGTSFSAPSRPAYSAPAPSRPAYVAPSRPAYVAPSRPAYVAPARVETPRYTPPARVETPRQTYTAPARVETRHESPRIETPKATTPSRVESSRPSVPSISQNSSSHSGSSTTSAQPEKKSGWGGFFGRKSDNSSTPKVDNRSNNGGSVRMDNSKQGGIGGQYKNTDLNGVKSTGGKNFQGEGKNGEKVNFRQNADGSKRITSVVKTDSSGREVKTKYDASGRKTAFESRGSNGSVTQGRFHKDGSKTVVTQNSNGSRVVMNSKRGGFVEKSYSRNGRNITQRTYVNHVTNRTYVRNYYSDYYGYRNYSPYYHFNSAFYTGFLLGSIWSTPYYYSYNSWGWYSNAWMFAPASPYAYYFTPYVDYSDPVDWVTDYVIADTLAQSVQEQANVDAQQDAEQDQLADQQEQLSADQAQLRGQVEELKREIKDQKGSDNSAVVRAEVADKSQKAVITKEIKAQISNQVREELKAHQNESSVPLASVLSDLKYIFLVSEETDASYADSEGKEQECTLGEGDLFTLNKVVAQGETTAEIRVKAAKKTDDSCKTGTVLTVAVKTLEDIKSELSARAEAGAKAAQDHKLPGTESSSATQVNPESASSQQEAVQELKQAEQQAKDAGQAGN